MNKINIVFVTSLLALVISDPSFGIEQKFHCPLSQDIKVHGDAMSDPADPTKKTVGATADQDGRLFTSHSWTTEPLESKATRIVYYENGNMECYYKLKEPLNKTGYALIFTNISGWNKCGFPKSEEESFAGATFMDCTEKEDCYLRCEG